MSKGNKGNQPERQLAALTKRVASYTTLYTEDFEAQFTWGILYFTDKPVS
jgi:hypothetical protein